MGVGISSVTEKRNYDDVNRVKNKLTANSPWIDLSIR